MAKAYIYCRVSSKEQGNNLAGHVSLEVQENNCKEYAERHGMVVGEVVKEVCSARNMKKLKNLTSLINLMKKKKEKATLLINSVSRFSRNTLEALLLFEDLKKHQISIVFVQEQLSMNTSAGRHTFRILLSNAEYESDQISDRVRQAFALKRQLGSELGRPPYGYEVRIETTDAMVNIRKFVENEDEQRIIRFICAVFERNNTQAELTTMLTAIKGSRVEPVNISNITHQTVANVLNRREIFRRGAMWSSGTVASVVKKYCPDTQPPTRVSTSSRMNVVSSTRRTSVQERMSTGVSRIRSPLSNEKRMEVDESNIVTGPRTRSKGPAIPIQLPERTIRRSRKGRMEEDDVHIPAPRRTNNRRTREAMEEDEEVSIIDEMTSDNTNKRRRMNRLSDVTDFLDGMSL